MDAQSDDEIVTLELPRSRALILHDLADDLAMAKHFGRHIRIMLMVLGWAFGGAAAALTVWQYYHGAK